MTRRKWFSRPIAIGAVLIAACVALSSCRTMEGLGEDLSHLGAKISGKAREKSG
jgi:predicted small secreted protein